MTSRRVAVVGLGAATSLGLDVEDVWQAVLDGRSGVAPITQFPSAGFPMRIASEVDLTRLRERLAFADRAPSNRTLAFACWAADRAWENAGLANQPVDVARTAVCVGAGLFPVMEERLDGLTPAILDDPRALLHRGLARAERRAAQEQPDLGSVSLALARRFGAGGPARTVHSACASATQAIGDAYRMIQAGRADVVVTGGADSMVSMFCVAGFTLLGALSRNPDPARASRPFDRLRDGFVLGEGAGIVILEDMAHAERRGARILAEAIGYGSSMDAYRFTDMHPDGRGAAQCLQRALDDAGIDAAAVDYINAHGTSTPQNDRVETRAITNVFGEAARSVAISSTKSQLGHLLCAAGGIEYVLTVLALRDQVAPPTINLEQPDPECDLDYVPNTCRPARIDVALSNSFGFGGQNATLVVRRWTGDAA